MKVFCDSNHKMKTNTRRKNVINITNYRVIRLNNYHCTIFTRRFCEINHVAMPSTPGFEVICVTLLAVDWTA